jgi:hypothetical protein
MPRRKIAIVVGILFFVQMAEGHARGKVVVTV